MNNNNTLEKNKRLASLAVFREMYDKEKDIYNIISDFLTAIIISNKLRKFNISEIAYKLKEDFGFEIPEASISTSLKRLKFTKDYGNYIVGEDFHQSERSIIDLQKKNQDSNDDIVNNLYNYVESKKNLKLTDDEKKIVSSSFCSFILDESSEYEFSQFISAFIIENKSDNEFINKLNRIKEGVILYSGLKYTPNLNERGTWKTEITIFLETEILFHLAGYNGELYQKIFYDFYNLVKEINQDSIKKEKKPKIYLKYFSKVKSDIESFFYAAEQLLRRSDTILDYRKQAMVEILNGCTAPSDIVSKKSKLFYFMDSMGILEDDYNKDYFDLANQNHLVIDKNFDKKISENIVNERSISRLEFLDFINIRRKGISKASFENIKYILLTENNAILSAGHNKENFPGFPPCKGLNFFINEFWFKLNKGFGGNNLPQNFAVITRSQTILKSMIDQSLERKYKKLKDQYEKKEISDEEISSHLAFLRQAPKQPEQITVEEVPNVLAYIDEDKIEKTIQEQAHFKIKYLDTEREKKFLAEKNKQLDEENTQIRNEIELFKKQNIKKKELWDKIIRLIFIAFSLFGVVLIYLYQETIENFIKNIIGEQFINIIILIYAIAGSPSLMTIFSWLKKNFKKKNNL